MKWIRLLVPLIGWVATSLALTPPGEVPMGGLAVRACPGGETLLTRGLGPCMGLALVGKRDANQVVAIGLAHINPTADAERMVGRMVDELRAQGNPLGIEARLVGGWKPFGAVDLDENIREALKSRDIPLTEDSEFTNHPPTDSNGKLRYIRFRVSCDGTFHAENDPNPPRQPD